MHRNLTMAGLAALASLAFGSPSDVQAQVVYYPPRVVVTSYYAPAPVPVVSYYTPTPVVSYYAPVPVVSYYAPAPVVPVTSYYAATTTYVAPRRFRPRVYVSPYYAPVFVR
jgi:hypothetical protein